MFNFRLNKILYIIYFCFFISNMLGQKLFDKKRLDYNAVIEGYGYKTSNLIELNKLCDNIKKSEEESLRLYSVRVPDFVGIRSSEIKKFFKDNGIDIDNEVKAFVPKISNMDSIQYLKNYSNKEAFIKASEKLASKIENLYVDDKNINLKKVIDFLNKGNSLGWRLMVRSTGKEDTKELPNAGGNESIPNVSPNKVDVMKAIQQVVASYFKGKSLRQRIDAGDKDIFKLPITPVLLQRMVGESIGGEDDEEKISVGAVVYTGEVEAETSDVITIQGSWGHNEGVVGSEVPVDTYYVKNGNVRSIIQKKFQRIIPVQTNDGFGLELIMNPKNIVKKAVLKDDDARAIASAAREVHKYYKNEPNDIELVFEPFNRFIYFVQTRPLQIVNHIESSYFTNLVDIANQNKVKCSVLSASGGAVRHIQDKKEIIVGSTLEDALYVYLSKGDDKDQVSVVIVKGFAEATSHAAAVLRGAGKAILICPEINKIKKLVNEGELDLFIDVQREVAINAKEIDRFKGKTIKELIDEGIIKIGWFKHPIAQRLSIQDVLPFYGPYIQNENLKDKTKKELIEIMKSGEENQAISALYDLLNRIHSLVFEKKSERLQKLYNVATSLSQEMLKEKLFAKKDRDIERLYAINFLEAILFQEHETSKYVNIYSVESVLYDLEKTQRFITSRLSHIDKKELERIINNPKILSIMIEGVNASLNSDLENKWINFIKEIVLLDKKVDIDKLTNIFKTTKKLNVFSMWINTIFSGKNDNDKQELLESLNIDIEQSRKKLDTFFKKKIWLDTFDQSLFDHPKNIKKQIPNFIKHIQKYFVSEDFLNVFNDKSLLLKEVAITLMTQIVDKWDKAIKTLKSSVHYKLKDKFIVMQKMLSINYSFLKAWVRVPGDGFLSEALESFVEWQDFDVDNYLKGNLSNNKGEKWIEKQLEPSTSFVVNKSILASSVDIFVPDTLEDFFTWIHQNQLNIINLLIKEFCTDLHFNKWVELIIQKVTDSEYKASSSKFMLISTGYKFIKSGVVFEYNIPLREHSLGLNIKYDKALEEVFIKMIFYGANEQARWNKISDYVEIISALTEIPLGEKKIDKSGIVFEFILNKKIDGKNVFILINEISQFINITFNPVAFTSGEFVVSHEYYLKYSNSFLESLYKEFKEVNVIKTIFLLSLNGERINWLFPAVLERFNILKSDYSKEAFKILQILQKNTLYLNETILFVFKCFSDPRFFSDYNLLNLSNYKEKLSDFVIDEVKNIVLNNIIMPLIYVSYNGNVEKVVYLQWMSDLNFDQRSWDDYLQKFIKK